MPDEQFAFDSLPHDVREIIRGLIGAQSGDVLVRSRAGISLGRDVLPGPAEIISRLLDARADRPEPRALRGPKTPMVRPLRALP